MRLRQSFSCYTQTFLRLLCFFCLLSRFSRKRFAYFARGESLSHSTIIIAFMQHFQNLLSCRALLIYIEATIIISKLISFNYLKMLKEVLCALYYSWSYFMHFKLNISFNTIHIHSVIVISSIVTAQLNLNMSWSFTW